MAFEGTAFNSIYKMTMSPLSMWEVGAFLIALTKLEEILFKNYVFLAY